MPIFVGAGTSSFLKDADGVGIPQQTTTQINNMTGMVAGQIVYDTDLSVVKFYDGSGWLKISSLVPTLTNVSGQIFAGLTSTLTLTGTNFLTANLVVNFTQSSDGIDVDVTVTPASDTSASVIVPSSVFNSVTAGNVVVIKVTNSDFVVSNTQNVTASALPSGGTETSSGGYTYHTFTSSGNFTNTISSLSVEYLLVGGGGSGGPGTAGGGGAGGVLQSSGTLTPQVYSIVIGGGGSGSQTPTVNYNSGTPTTAFGSTAVGGGRGGGTQNQVQYPAGSGGSGGGGAYYPGTPGPVAAGSGTSGQGNSGGTSTSDSFESGGGGGGAASGGQPAGNPPSSRKAGNGGNGTNAYSTWHSATGTGSGGYVGGGGGGGNGPGYGTPSGGAGGGGTGSQNQSTSGSGAVNTGGGGGGSWNYGQSPYGSGGSGLVIVRYQL